MNLVLDSNIFISGLITPDGTISKLILRDLKDSTLICPDFLLDEVLSKLGKIKGITKLNDNQIDELIFRFIKRIDFIDNDLIEFKYQKQAYDLVKDIDKKDLLFIALSIQTGFKLWTGDKKLMEGLKKKGFDLMIDTKQLL
ncbi:PIN domain-containing protein [Mariniphaga sp.]|uniref:PIN domain-containing protein n=1 Tax=Mariniphaga sp. TaxID=1954475 RepID=UPI003563BC1F